MARKLNFGALLLIISLSVRSEARNLQSSNATDDINTPDTPTDEVPRPFYLEEIYKGGYGASGFGGAWISDNEIIYDDDMVGIVKHNVETEKVSTLLKSSVLDKYNSSYSYKLSSDHTHMLIGYEPQSKFRHSVFYKYDVYDLKNNSSEKIADGKAILLALWSPVGHSLIYEIDNDLYYRHIAENGSAIIRRLTTDGVVGIIYNGMPDWVYEEEVMGTRSSLWFSPDGRHLAFASFNDTLVHDASYFYYGAPGDVTYQYPAEVKFKYPKVGTTNPQVKLNLVDLTDPNSKLISLKTPVDVVTNDHILFSVNWFTNETVGAVWTNRVQNVGEIVSYDIHGKSNYLLKLEEKKGWLEVSTPVVYEDKLLLLKYQETNTMDGRYNHITSYDLINGSSLTNENDLSPLNSAVHSLLSIDSETREMYYLAMEPGQPSRRHLYSSPVDGKKRPTCLSCEVLTPEGNNCTYAKALFSENSSYYALTCSGPDPATVDIYNKYHKKIRSWQSNQFLRQKLKKRLSTTLKTVSVRVNGYLSRARLELPPGFKESKSYPMIVQVYAGPNTAAIRDVRSYSYNSYYATNRSVIWAVIDGRGSAYRGSEMLFEIYRALGTVEIEDQIAVTKELQKMFPWIDSKRTAIWGWSYGGYATAMALATDKENIFKCGISVAPVSSWIYYDSIYTERYMGLPTPEDNYAGYNRSDVNRLVEGIRGKKFMLIHGTGDDNVHYQQSMALGKSLAVADIQFEQISYPDEAHGLVGVTPHLAHSMDHFWGECLNLTYAK